MKKIYQLLVKVLTLISPELCSRFIYRVKFKEKLNLKNPRKFNEKLMWLKLKNYMNNSVVWSCVDKYCVRQFILSKGISEDNLPKIIKRYNNAEEINFSELPDKFALKCTHGCGFNIICRDKSKLNEEEAKKKLDKWQKTTFGYETAELQYTHIKPTIICEKFIDSSENGFPYDYKIYCFNGVPKIVLVCTDREKKYKTYFYDIDWNKIFVRDGQCTDDITPPKSLEKMINISKKLSEDFPFVRVDFYELNGEPIIGEMTFTPAACLGEYTKEASIMMGDWIDLEN